MKELIPIHLGLVGHIDHGKTELARVLSERTSTAGLDKHPQSKKRGITIDLGFTMFTLGDLLVTLVDAPGHADLIRSVVAGANIIDAAILVVAADEGPKVQTGEHIVVLQSMGITDVVVAITKTDLVSENEASKVQDQVEKIMSTAGFKDVDVARISTLTGNGVNDLKEILKKILKPKTRDLVGEFLMPVDHAFPIKGHGTVITGTVLRGVVSIDDTLELMPQSLPARVRAIQTFGEARSSAEAGARIGMNMPDIDHLVVSRGNYLAKPGSISRTSGVVIAVHRNPLYKDRITKRMIISSMVGMLNVTAELIPLNSSGIIVDETKEESFTAALLLQERIAAEVGMKVLLMRTDLPPTRMRIVAAGEIVEIPERILLKRRRLRTGRISRIRTEDVLVEGIASSKNIAERMNGLSVMTLSGVKGTLKRPFGTRGVISAIFEDEVRESDEVLFERLTEEEYTFGC
ncbi:MAG: selenocysteine-specific translation elongation factor [Candidatus Hodarchaeota archaeon]